MERGEGEGEGELEGDGEVEGEGEGEEREYAETWGNIPKASSNGKTKQRMK